MELPDVYNFKDEEPKIREFWEKHKIYKFDPNSDKELYTVDTPPPTVSGKMHIGHAFSYSQQDFIIRYQRMIGKNVFYPFGTDDNGLATERLIEKTKNVRANKMDRNEFIKLCLETLKEIRPAFVQDWKNIGCSADFDIFYSTIDPHCRKISQKSFIDLYKMGREYQKEAPTIWCPHCQTAIAQVEMQDHEKESAFIDIIFKTEDKKDLIIATTRPELLGSCVAVFFHPDDERYKPLLGQKAIVPLFNNKVPILADERADPQKGTGLVMCCTFGDQTDIEWYKAHNLPLKISITHDGLMNENAGKYKGLKIKEAREKIIEDLKTSNLLIKEKKITHAVNVHERCSTEIEILNTKQWFIKYLDLKDKFIDAGKRMKWHPEFMRVRYDNWINGLQWDWCISRQRFSGVPFPVWYCKKCGEVMLAEEKQLPVDPLTDKPLKPCKCGSKEFIGEKDVLDTWATSSLTPTLAVDLFKNHKIHKKLFPMDLRPQAHDIITFWLFNTVVKSILHHNKTPWKEIVISGFALDPHGKKMSKSKGNAVDPRDVLDKYGADCLRFWAAGSKLGEDLPYQEKDLVTGKKMVTKLWNASKFALMHFSDYNMEKPELETMDKWVLAKLQRLIKNSTESFNEYEYSKAKMELEKFFWQVFCDNYLEIVKDRLYNPEKRGAEKKKAAQYALYNALLAIIKISAPLMPYITEAVYQTYYAKKENCISVHISRWPKHNKDLEDSISEAAGDMIVDIISAARKYKSEKKVSLKAEIAKLTIECDKKTEELINLGIDDLKATISAVDIGFGKGEIACNEKVKISIALKEE